MAGMRERAADAAREVPIGPFGPNALTIVSTGGRTFLTSWEANDIAAAVLAVVADVDEIAGVLLYSMSACCEKCRVQDSNVDEANRQAQAVVAHLLGQQP